MKRVNPGKGKSVEFGAEHAPAAVLPPKIGGLHFAIPAKIGEVILDFRDVKSRGIALAFASQIWSKYVDDGNLRSKSGISKKIEDVRQFIDFLEARGVADRFEKITPLILDEYEDLLNRQFSTHGALNKLGVSRWLLVSLVDGGYPLQQGLVARLSYLTARTQRPKSRPRDSYSPYVVRQLIRAARRDVVKIARRLRGEGRKVHADEVDLVAAVDRDVLDFGAITASSESYKALRSHRLRLGRDCSNLLLSLNSRRSLTTDDLVPILVLLLLSTGIELESCCMLEANCLSEGGAGAATLNYVKSRAGYSVKQKAIEDGGLRSPAGLIRQVALWTQGIRSAKRSQYLFCYINNARMNCGVPRISLPAKRWCLHHGIQSDDLAPLNLTLSRLRKVHKQISYLKSGGNIRKFSPDNTLYVAVASYAEIKSNTNVHESAVQSAFEDIHQLAESVIGPVVVGDEATPLAQDTWVATCRDPRSGPFVAKGELCSHSSLGCIECPNAVFSARKLPGLLLVLDEIKGLREQLGSDEWRHRFGRPFHRIASQILPKFSEAEVERARSEASLSTSRPYIPVQVMQS